LGLHATRRAPSAAIEEARVTYRTASEAETIALGERLARELPPSGVVLLIGNLGAGKTTLAKGIVTGLGAASADEVSSPTFTLIHEYGEGRVYHVDLYRLDEPRQVATLGLDEIFDRDGLVLIEWGERFPGLLPAERTEIRIRSLVDDEREIEIVQLAGKNAS
jgi:tRNA threonylcarbamoyladenosine biosynthesis protein TsaE